MQVRGSSPSGEMQGRSKGAACQDAEEEHGRLPLLICGWPCSLPNARLRGRRRGTPYQGHRILRASGGKAGRTRRDNGSPRWTAAESHTAATELLGVPAKFHGAEVDHLIDGAVPDSPSPRSPPATVDSRATQAPPAPPPCLAPWMGLLRLRCGRRDGLAAGVRRCGEARGGRRPVAGRGSVRGRWRNRRWRRSDFFLFCPSFYGRE
jgi:hypothetical protein